MIKKLTLDYIGNQEYRAENGRTVKRESEYDGKWVYRNANGKVVDFDQYRDALCFRNNLELK